MKDDYLRFEREFLSPYATLSENTKGRERPLEACPMRTEFQRDRDRIIHCKSFRRLKHKTQVFLSPTGDHYRTRLTHTLEVTQIARTISRALCLNEDLTEAIALGHDLGHTPFGHAGERALDQKTGHFAHNEQSLRVVELLEENGAGLNLTYEVRDGILNHRSKDNPATLEGKVVNYADRIAYLNHDIDDAVRAGLMLESDIPRDIEALLGSGKGKKIDALVRDIVASSYDKPRISLSPPYEEALADLKKFMLEKIYFKSRAKTEEIKAERLLSMLFDFLIQNPDEIPALYKIHTGDAVRAATDYIAGMSDTYVIKVFQSYFVPDIWDD